MRLSQHIFIKHLERQESGYSAGKTGNANRGRYVFVFSEAWKTVFPILRNTEMNPQRPLYILGDDRKWTGLTYVWHNARFHPQEMRKRKISKPWNERRLYRNAGIDKAFFLDAGVAFIMVPVSINIGGKKPKDIFLGLSSAERQNFKKELHGLLKTEGPYTIKSLRDWCPNIYSKLEEREKLTNATIRTSGLPKLEDIEYAFKDFLGMQVAKNAVPGKDPFNDKKYKRLFATRAKFTKAVRLLYDGKCAVRGTSLVKQEFVGLEAAHIHEHQYSENNSPSNGVLLSGDLHAAFDAKYWTIDKTYKIRVDKKAAQKELLQYNGRRILLPQWRELSPYRGYLAWHNKQFAQRLKQ